MFASCGSMMPWRGEEPANEVNLAFNIENNLLFLSTANLNRQPGRVFFGSASPKTVVDRAFAAKLNTRKYEFHLNERETLPVNPVVVDLNGIGDAMIGADVFGSHAVTIDYRSGLLTYQKDGIHPDYMSIYRFDAEPRILALVDGRSIPAVVDTALPDTLVLPRGASPAGRRKAKIEIAGTDLGTVDVALGDVAQARVGNRLLSKFLVSVDYGRREVGLWRDPRIR